MKARRFNKLAAWLLTLAMLMTLFTVPVSADEAPADKWSEYAAADFGGGTGEVDDPYLIATEEQLAKLSVDVAGGNEYKGKWFRLEDNLDLSAHRWNPIGQYRWEDDGTEYGNFIFTDFSGNFDGNGKTIRGIYVDEATDGFSGGLFGSITNSAANDSVLQIEIRDLTIEDAVIYGKEEGLIQGYSGILGAYASAEIGRNILIENVHVSGSLNITCVKGNYAVGGMVGYADNITFTDCTVDDIYQYAATNSGGFTGVSTNCTYTDCSAQGTVYGSWCMGGFAGYTTLQNSSDGETHSTFTRCIADVDVIANDWNVGGFVGLSVGGVFTDCAALGDVYSQVTDWEPNAAGFAGKLQAKYDDSKPGPYPSILINCYFAGEISSEHATIQPSGLVAVGAADSTITDCAYDGDKNPDIEGYPGEEETTAFSTSETGSAICENIHGGHDMDENNSCTVCGYTEYGITLGGVQVTNENVADILDDGTASYDEQSNTLTLSDCTAYGNGSHLSALEIRRDLTIVLEGESFLYGVDGDTGVNAGIDVDGNLTITGTGILNAVGGDGSGHTSAGIYAHNGDLVIEGGCTVNATAKSAQTYSVGIFNEQRSITIDSATVKAVAGDVVDGPSWGIQASDIEFRNATVTASGNDMAVTPEPELDYEKGYRWRNEDESELYETVIDWSAGDIAKYLHIEPRAVATVRVKAVDEFGDFEDPGNAPALAGMRFNILDEDGNVVREGLETAEGELAETELDTDAAYKIVVTKPSDGFAIPQAIDFTIDEDGNVETASGNNSDNVIAIELHPCEIQLFAPVGSKFNITYEENGEAKTLLTQEIEIPAATQLTGFKHETEYTIVFEAAPAGYNLPDDVKFRFSELGVFEATELGGHAIEGEGELADIDVVYNLEETEVQSRPSSGGSTTRYTVKFETNGGSAVESKRIARNYAFAEPTAPTREGYTFAGWYTDEELTAAYDFSTKVTKDMTLYAKWNAVEDEAPQGFTDVNPGDWFYDDVVYAVENGLFNGVSATKFAPNADITRAMMVTVLYRLEGEPEVTGTSVFSDTDENAYYARAVVWGQQNGIIKGISETEFAPDDDITREQIAAIMHRYAQYKGYDVSAGENTNILSYDDYAQIFEYAIEPMQYAVGSGLMRGKTASTLAPKDSATRAEIAAILRRFIEANK